MGGEETVAPVRNSGAAASRRRVADLAVTAAACGRAFSDRRAMTLVMLVAARRSWGAGACARRARTPMSTLRQLVTKPPRSRESTDVIQRAEQHITDDGDDDGNDDPGGEYNHQAQLEHPKLTRRMDAIRTLHARQAQLQAELAQRIMQLEAECEEKLAPLYDRRAEIVSGASEPTDAEAKPLEEYVAVEPDLALEDAEPGIPGFWLAALTNHHTVGDQITEEDAAVLDHLVDVRSERFGTPAAEGEVAMTPEEQGFRLVFRFAPNPYFADAELVKTVWMDEGFPARAQGMAIQWKEGMDVTHKVCVGGARAHTHRVRASAARTRAPSCTPSPLTRPRPRALSCAAARPGGGQGVEEEEEDGEDARAAAILLPLLPPGRPRVRRRARRDGSGVRGARRRG